mgnify:CR=1 FL=1|tara:strand:+ start:297 stop:602 length:306 start_codon:yes stop_codon:yes gene_type:complete
MTNLDEIQKQISILQQQAVVIKKKETKLLINEMLEKMALFDISIDDLKIAQSRLIKNKSNGVAVKIKYKGPLGETWTGRGLMPRWLSELVNQGVKKEDFLI